LWLHVWMQQEIAMSQDATSALQEPHLQGGPIHEQLSAWLDQMAPWGVLLTDRELKIQGWNRWLEIHSRLNRIDLLGQHLLEVFPEIVERGKEGFYRSALEGSVVVLAQRIHGYLLRFSLARPVGGFQEMQQRIQISPLWKEKEVIGTLTLIEDVTDRVVVEDTLRASERYFRTLIEHSTDIIAVVDSGGVLHYVSPSVEKALGYHPARLLQRNLKDLVHPEDAQKTLVQLQTLLSGGSSAPFSWVFRVRNSQGKWRFIEAVATCYPAEHGEDRVVLDGRDITERLRMAEELARARKLESLGILAGGIAHDFNNLLTVILGNISIALADLDSQSTEYQFLREAEDATRRAGQLTQRFLAFSRGAALVRENIDVGRLVQEAIQGVVAEGSHWSVQCEVQDGIADLHVDGAQMCQAIRSLLLNAMEAMPQGGTIRVQARELPLKETPMVQISVTDTGAGIPPEHLDKIFDPYFSTKERGSEKGMGLGLTVAHAIVTNHGGKVEVESSPGQGTTVRLLLPVSKDREVKGS
jgi:PAS domain S-box-containing protein